jgi:DNA-binding IclR family transcriptional regulator
MEAAAQFTFWPVIEEKLSKRSVLRQLLDAVERHGALATVGTTAKALGVHRSRIYQLLEEGKLAKVNIDGSVHIVVASLELYLTEEHKSGRPRKLDTTLATFCRLVGVS